MAVELRDTKTLCEDAGVKILLYGASGNGKTYSLSTMPGVETGKALIISTEKKFLALKKKHMPSIPAYAISTPKEIGEIFSIIEKSDYESIGFDSLTDYANLVLAEEKISNPDGRMAYLKMEERVNVLVRSFLELKGKNIIFIAQLEQEKDEMSRILYSPTIPGEKAGRRLPYPFDQVICARTTVNEKQETSYFFQTRSDGFYRAKCSGDVNIYEPANISDLIKKIKGE